jgi:CelD/BcsL family acetyltransferase involved in cellulose biosynthesis
VPGGKPYKRPVSKAQARFFGLAAAGKVPGFSVTEAKNKLRGVKEAKLPARKRKKTRG